MEALKQCDCSNIPDYDELYKLCFSTFARPNGIAVVKSSDPSRTSLSIVCSCLYFSFLLIQLPPLLNSHLRTRNSRFTGHGERGTYPHSFRCRRPRFLLNPISPFRPLTPPPVLPFPLLATKLTPSHGFNQHSYTTPPIPRHLRRRSLCSLHNLDNGQSTD